MTEEETEPEANMAAGEFALVAADVLSASPFPALVLEVPSERIVAASPGSMALLDPDGGMVVGHLLEEFTVDRPAVGVDVFAGGHLNGFETFRVLRRRDGADVQVRLWIRDFKGQPSTRFVVVVLVADDWTSEKGRGDWRESPAVVGTADASLLIERVSADAEILFDVPVTDLLGTSLLRLVAPADVAGCLAGLSEASSSQNGVTLHLSLRSGDARPALRCEVIFLPLQPSPSCAFVLLPIPDGADGVSDSGDLSEILLRMGRGSEIARLARGVFRGVSGRSVPGLSALTTRELEIVMRLLEGDRPPAIARNLHLSQSTVRNHLASVFTKVGVNSQQELLDAFRAP